MASWRLPQRRGANSRVAIIAVALVAAMLPGQALALGGTGAIGGTVFDTSGMPAVGVLVFACSSTCTYVTSGANGAYSVTNLAPDNYRLGIEDGAGALAGGYATSTGITTDAAVASLIAVAATPVTFDIHATPGRLVGGTLTAVPGGPLAGVLVEACVVMPVMVDRQFAPCGFDSTAADGTYSLTVLPGTYLVYALDFGGTNASGYYSTSGYVLSSRAATRVAIGATDVAGINLALPAGASIAGTVTDSTGAPAVGMAVEPCLETDITACGFTSTGADGSYSVDGLPLGSYRVILVDPGALYPTGFYSGAGFTGDSGQASPVVVGASGASGIDVKLATGHVASGVVLDAAGRPARVDIDDCTATFCVRVVETGADGSYEINLAPGRHAIHAGDLSGANLSGYYSTAGLANSAHVTNLTVGSADLPGINFRLRRIVGGTHAGTAHAGKYATTTVVRKGTYATARFNLGKPFAGTRVTILRAGKNSGGVWSAYRRVATVVVAADGYAYYSTKASGYLAFEASVSDSLVEGVQVVSAPVFIRGK